MRILLVEDERRIAQSIKKGLEQERYAVDMVFDGIQGYDMASTEEYDCVVLDIMLPGMDGISLTSKLRKDKVRSPILMLTAKSQIPDKVRGLDAGADDYLTKPFSFEELLARIRALTRRPAENLTTQLVVEDLMLDVTNFTVTRSKKTIHLTHKEFALLEYLMRRPGVIHSKDQIMAHVWDYDADILPNTVEVYIRNLRNKIDVPFPSKKPLISTVRGFGYRLGK
jgi:DNA-binding response OmpR family regulator